MNPLMQMFGNAQNFQRQKVQELLNNGQMSQQQFNMLRMMANQITGRRM